MVNVQVTGDALENLKKYIEQFPDKIEDCIKAAAFDIEREAKQNINSEATGTLRRSITTTVEKDGDTVAAVVSTNVSYAPYYHEGTGIFSRSGSGRSEVPWVYYDNGQFYTTSGIKSNPFLENAANAVSSRIEEYFVGALDNE